jgi:hypothetical protein
MFNTENEFFTLQFDNKLCSEKGNIFIALLLLFNTENAFLVLKNTAKNKKYLLLVQSKTSITRQIKHEEKNKGNIDYPRWSAPEGESGERSPMDS